MGGSSFKKLLDTSDQLLISPWKNGVQLVQPSQFKAEIITDQLSFRVENLMNLDVNVYFLNMNSEIQRINEATSRVFNFTSPKNALWRTALDVTLKNTGIQFLNNDKKVLQTQKYSLEIEECILDNNEYFNSLSLKMPWYEKDCLVGLLGLSFLPISILRGSDERHQEQSECSLLKILPQIIRSHHEVNVDKDLSPLHSSNRLKLTRRQGDCLYYLSKGRTAKEIAKILKLSPRTVEHYLDAIKIKWSCSSKSMLIEYAEQYFNASNE